MKSEKIQFCDVMSLDFVEKKQFDPVYYEIFGFDWSIIQLDLSDTVYLDWSKETQLCELIEIDSLYHGNIIKREPVRDLNQLKEIIKLFLKKRRVN